MDVILHVGAHRAGSTSFQNYLRANHAAFERLHLAFWGPWRTRQGFLNTVANRPKSLAAGARDMGRVQMNVAGLAEKGFGTLVVSDENMLGTVRRCQREMVLYPEVGERMARLHTAFQTPKRIVLQIRSLDSWWASVFAFLIPRGADVPMAGTLQAVVDSPRSWRHVIADLACACPNSEIMVTPFERFADRPDHLLHKMTGLGDLPALRSSQYWSNRSPDLPALRHELEERGQKSTCLPDGDGRWQPFDDIQISHLRETYADDLHWLRAGADGMAQLIEDPGTKRPAQELAAALFERGHHNDRSARKLAATGRERAARPRA
ncbi:MAG: hypothetical protein N4A61_16650 [Pelagimonas sp.]|jgi:hypothetical protein|nr:hypothetical protein [Pelagimonas sp.]